jgi:calcium permeable stress-gated cation channel
MRNAYGPLIKALPLTLADSSYNRVEPEVPAAADAPKRMPPSTEDIDYADYAAYADVSSPSLQHVSKAGPPLRNGTDSGPQKRVTDERPASPMSPMSLLAKLGFGDGPTDFRHPVTVEEQRVIWLPSDPLGVVKEIGRDLDSQEISHSTEGAEMDAKGQVDVILASEDVQDSP